MSRPFNKKDHPPRHRGQKIIAGSWQVSVDPGQCKEWMNRGYPLAIWHSYDIVISYGK